MTVPCRPLPTYAPFHLEATVRVLQRRPSNLVDTWHDGSYWRLLTLASGLALANVENRGTAGSPAIHFRIRAGNADSSRNAEAGPHLRRMLGLDVDPEPFQRLAEAERSLRATAIALRGMRPPRFASLFEAFASVIPFQQLSIDAGVAIVGRLVSRFGERIDYQGRQYHAFPTAHSIASVPLARIKACGLSKPKATTLREIAGILESGAMTEAKLSALSTPQALGVLTTLPGIGPWSAALVLLRGLGRLDVFPPGDVGAMRGLRSLLRRGPHASLDRVIARFGEFRGHLYFYSLGASLLKSGLIHPAPGISAD